MLPRGRAVPTVSVTWLLRIGGGGGAKLTRGIKNFILQRGQI
jgi:hypothetical protein